MLDQFSANAPPQSSTRLPKKTLETTLPTSAPDKPEDASNLTKQPIPQGQKPGETEEEFVERLSAEMSKLFSGMAADADADGANQSPEDLAKMGKELEAFTRQMEDQGVKPEDLLKAIMGEEEGTKIANVATAERERRKSEKHTSRPGSSSQETKTSNRGNTSFEDTIRQTMSRLSESDNQAKTASQESANKSEEDMLAEMLKALDSGGGDGGEDGISKMFLDMMHQLTHKSMLYEPMKELHEQYPGWLAGNKPPKLKQEDYDRYKRQSEIVRDITNKFEEPNFKDEDEECRQYIWNKMQDMQSQGAPPEELVKNPFPGTDFGSIPGLGGGGGGEGGDDEGCPTQ